MALSGKVESITTHIQRSDESSTARAAAPKTKIFGKCWWKVQFKLSDSLSAGKKGLSDSQSSDRKLSQY